jgi:hypothetical protein
MIHAEIEVDYSGLRGLTTVAKERSVTLKAVKAGAKLVQAQAKANAPRRKGGGALRQSQGVKAVKGKVGKTIAIAVIGARKKVEKMFRRGRRSNRVVPANYSHLVNRGTRAHTIGKGSKLGRNGKVAKAQTGGTHPGAKASHYLDNAWESTQARATAAAMQVMTVEIMKAIGKAAAGFKTKGLK